MKTNNDNPRAAGEAAHTPVYSIAEMRDGKTYLKRANLSGTFTLVACFDADYTKPEEMGRIVRACNSHAASVAALAKAHEELTAALPFLSVKYGNRDAAKATLLQITAALKLATQ